MRPGAHGRLRLGFTAMVSGCPQSWRRGRPGRSRPRSGRSPRLSGRPAPVRPAATRQPATCVASPTFPRSGARRSSAGSAAGTHLKALTSSWCDLQRKSGGGLRKPLKGRAGSRSTEGSTSRPTGARSGRGSADQPLASPSTPSARRPSSPGEDDRGRGCAATRPPVGASLDTFGKTPTVPVTAPRTAARLSAALRRSRQQNQPSWTQPWRLMSP